MKGVAGDGGAAGFAGTATASPDGAEEDDVGVLAEEVELEET